MLITIGVWAELEGGADGGIRAEYGLEYSWTAGEDGSLDVTVATVSEEAEGELTRRKQVCSGGGEEGHRGSEAQGE